MSIPESWPNRTSTDGLPIATSSPSGPGFHKKLALSSYATIDKYMHLTQSRSGRGHDWETRRYSKSQSRASCWRPTRLTVLIAGLCCLIIIHRTLLSNDVKVDVYVNDNNVPPDVHPWSHMSMDWVGHKLLSPRRFGNLDKPTIFSVEEQEKPPLNYIQTMYSRFANAKVDWRTQDPYTGNPLLIPHDHLNFKHAGWQKPKMAIKELVDGEFASNFPPVQANFRIGISRKRAMEDRQRIVKQAFLHAWEGYKKHAWGHDELKPISGSYKNPYNGWGATIIDNLDTLLMMGLDEEYKQARKHVQEVDFRYIVFHDENCFSTTLPTFESMNKPTSRKNGFCDPQLAIPFFETTIRYLGGLLSAYELSHDPLLLTRAKELGDWLLPNLSTKFGLPRTWHFLGHNPSGLRSETVMLAEAGSIQMEFLKLSMLTNDSTYFYAAQRAIDVLDTGFAPEEDSNGQRLGTLLPRLIDADWPHRLDGIYGLGSMSDSYYEYLIKMFQFSGGALPQYKRMYSDAMDATIKHLLKPITHIRGWSNMTLMGMKNSGHWVSELEHLVCFAGGMMELGSRLLPERVHDMGFGINITNACTWTYLSAATGVGPETVTFASAEDTSAYILIDVPMAGGKTRKERVYHGNPPGISSSDSKAIGRPETIESVFYSWRITGDPYWQDLGWKMFKSWVSKSLTPYGFGAIKNVNDKDSELDDGMQSFVLCETLKYYYLLFSPPDFFSLDDWVFTTEAHPFRVVKPMNNATESPVFTELEFGGSDDVMHETEIGKGTPVQLWSRVHQASGWSWME